MVDHPLILHYGDRTFAFCRPLSLLTTLKLLNLEISKFIWSYPETVE